MKIKLRFRGKCFFTVFVIAIFAFLWYIPVAVKATDPGIDPMGNSYYNRQIYDTQYNITYKQLPYSTGVADANGTIPITYGTGNITSTNNTVLDTWDTSYIKKGVIIGGYNEELDEVSILQNGSGLPASIAPTQTCYYTNLNYGVSNFSSYDVMTNVINVVSYYLKIPATLIMNGAQEIWYRSPLRWDDTVYDGTQHYLNIFDSSGALVFASFNSDLTNPTPDPKIVLDRSGYERVYYKLNFPFRSDQQYHVMEYVKTIGNNPINKVDLFFVRMQDIGADGEMNTYLFVNAPQARKIPIECSFGIIATLGMGAAGSEYLLYGNYTYHSALNHPTIYTNEIAGSTTITNTGSIWVIFPIRTTRPLNISISYRVWSGASFQNWVSPADGIVNSITGTLIKNINITDPDITKTNIYQFAFTILNMGDDYGSYNASETAMTFTIYPTGGNDTSMIQTGPSNFTVYHFATHVEISGEQTAIGTGQSKSPDYLTILIGIGLIALGIVLILGVFTSAFGAPLVVAGLGIVGNYIILGTLTAVGVISIAIGSLAIWQGANGMSPGQFAQWLMNGVVYILSSVYEGMKWLAGAIWNGIVQLVEALIKLGEAILYWGGIILNAIVEIIYFVAFILVMFLWNFFLNMMKYIAKGDIEGAWASIKKPLRRVEKKTIKYTKLATTLAMKKAAKRYSRKG
jgi:hypothetical protein